MINNIPVALYEKYQQDYIDKETLLAKELESLNFVDVSIEKGEDNTDFYTLVTYKGNTFKIRRDYNSIIHVVLHPHKFYEGVDYHQRALIYKEVYKSNSMKVMTKKKLIVKMEEELELDRQLTALSQKNIDKIKDFLETLKSTGLDVQFSYNYDKKITGGDIEKNGIRYSFEISESGYISEKIAVVYESGSKLEQFLKLIK